MSKTLRRMARFAIPAALVFAASTVFAPTASARTMFCNTPSVYWDSAYTSCSGTGWAILQGDCGNHYRVFDHDSTATRDSLYLQIRCNDHAPITNVRYTAA